MKLIRVMAPFCLLLMFAVPARATVINFDDLTPVDYAPLPSPYQGFDWTAFFYYDFADNAGFPTWLPGIASPPNAASSGGVDGSGQIVGTISRNTTFDFISAYFASVWYESMDLTVQGWRNGSLVYSSVVGVDDNGADKFTFNFANIDTVKIFGSVGIDDPIADCDGPNCSQFALDDFEYVSAVPEPTTMSLVGFGALAMLRRRVFGRR